MIPFGPWLPDQPSTLAEAVHIARNVWPHAAGYEAIQRWVSLIEAAEPFPLPDPPPGGGEYPPDEPGEWPPGAP